MPKRFYLLFCLIAIFPFLIYLNGSLSSDESYFLFMGNKTLHGLIPYTDYPTGGLKTPAIYYLNATIFLLFGDAIKVIYAARSLLFIINAMSAFVVYLIGRTLWNDKIGMLSSILFLIGMSIPAYQGYFQLTEPYMEFFGLIGILLLFRSEKYMYTLLSGISFGLSILFKQSGLLFIIAIYIFYLLNYFLSFWFAKESIKFGLKDIIVKLILISIGALLPLGLISIYFSSNGALNNFIYYAFVYTMTEYKQPVIIDGDFTYNLVFQFLSYGIVWIMSIISLIIISLKIVSNKYSSGELFTIIWLITSAYVLTIRLYGHYYIQILPPASLLASISLVRIYPKFPLIEFNDLLRKGDHLKILMHILILVIILATILIAPYSGYRMLDSRSLMFNYQMQTAEYIQLHTSHDEMILSYPYEPSIYLLSDRDPSINDLALPPFTSTDQIIKMICINKTKYIIMSCNFSNNICTNDQLCMYFSKNYEFEKLIGNFYIYRSKVY